MPLLIGEKAPNFTLKQKTSEGLVDVTPSENLGKKKVVLLFFPAAFTGVCTEEFCDASGGLGSFEKLNAAVYGISTDSPFAQEAWAKSSNISIPLLSDYARTVTEAYKVLLQDLAGLGPSSARAAFVIGTDGNIAYAEQTATPGDLPDFTKLKAVLA